MFAEVLKIRNVPPGFHCTFLPQKREQLAFYKTLGFFVVDKANHPDIFAAVDNAFKENNDGPITSGDMIMCAITEENYQKIQLMDKSFRDSRNKKGKKDFDRDMKEIEDVSMGNIKAIDVEKIEKRSKVA